MSASAVLQSKPIAPKMAKGKPRSYSSCPLYAKKDAQYKLRNLSIAHCNPSFERPLPPEEIPTLANIDSSISGRPDYSVSGKMACTCCSSSFITRDEQKDHYRSDWHRFNLKQQHRGLDTATEERFEWLMGDVSSISGSDSESDTSDAEAESSINTAKLNTISSRLQASLRSAPESDSDLNNDSQDFLTGRRYPKLFFRNEAGELISIYRSVIYHKKNPPSSQVDLVSMATSLPDHMTWAVLLAGGGHFASAIFERDKVVEHKTFHRYVVRAKCGTAQSSMDNQCAGGSGPKSAGAKLRRYNEAALSQEIQELLDNWSDKLKSCDIILLRAPSFNRHIFFGGKNAPFAKNDFRIRTIPFVTKRPTFKEVRRVHEMLALIECYGEESDIREFVPMSPRRHYDSNKGQLVARDDAKTLMTMWSPKKRQSKTLREPLAGVNNDRSEMGEDLPGVELDHLSDGDQSEEVDFQFVDEELSLLDLREYECSEGRQTEADRGTGDRWQHKQASKGRRRRKSSGKKDKDTFEDDEEETRFHLKNSLYTAVKLGNVNKLKELLEVLVNFNKDFKKNSTVNESFSIEKPSEDIKSNVPCSDVSNSIADSSKDYKTTCFTDVQINQVCIQNEVEIIEVCNLNDASSGIATTADSQTAEVDSVVTPNNQPMPELQDSGIKEVSFNMQISGNKCDGDCDFNDNLLNEQFGDNRTTLLHVASKHNNREAVMLLLEAGANPTIRDTRGHTAYMCTGDKETKNQFRRYRGRFPDKWDYTKSQIHDALTIKMENEKKGKEAEKKRAQKKAKVERQKERKKVEVQEQEEEKERQRYLSLSDREKRALAAERRLLKQVSEAGQSAPVLSRCWQCGVDITGKVPFEYNHFQFCMPKCLKQHRLGATTVKS